MKLPKFLRRKTEPEALPFSLPVGALQGQRAQALSGQKLAFRVHAIGKRRITDTIYKTDTGLYKLHRRTVIREPGLPAEFSLRPVAAAWVEKQLAGILWEREN